MDVWGAITQPTTSIVQEGMATDAKKNSHTIRQRKTHFIKERNHKLYRERRNHFQLLGSDLASGQIIVIMMTANIYIAHYVSAIVLSTLLILHN